jgi:chloramphenicol-sensitive protein RarD
MLVFRERLNTLQWLAVLLAAAGVLWLAWKLGSPPWLALVLAASFGTYGLVRKLAPFPALHSLAVESGVLLLPAIAWLVACQVRGSGVFLQGELRQDLLLVLGGPVTAVPLLLFAAGARRVSMTLLGVLQYISPSVALFVGIALLHEPFGVARQVAFGCIWLALAIFTLDGLRRYARSRDA